MKQRKDELNVSCIVNRVIGSERAQRRGTAMSRPKYRIECELVGVIVYSAVKYNWPLDADVFLESSYCGILLFNIMKLKLRRSYLFTDAFKRNMAPEYFKHV
jgi:hypothetical protein